MAGVSAPIPITKGKPPETPSARSGEGEIVGIWHGIPDLPSRWRNAVDVYAILAQRLAIAEALDLSGLGVADIVEAIQSVDAKVKFYTWCFNADTEEYLATVTPGEA